MHSIVNWGETSFDNVYQPSDAYSKYQTEKYNTLYKKNNYSPGLQIGFGFDWVSGPKFILRQELAVFGNSVTEKITFRIVDIGNGDTTWRDDYTTDKIKVGYGNTVADIGKSIGTKVGLLAMWKKDDLRIGAGLNWTRRFSEDVFRFAAEYNAWSWGRTTMGYLTHQLDADLRIEYSFGRLTTFVNYSQKFATLKKEKGGKYFDDSSVIYPFSHNLDFRYPSTITVGVQLNFNQISPK